MGSNVDDYLEIYSSQLGAYYGLMKLSNNSFATYSVFFNLVNGASQFQT